MCAKNRSAGFPADSQSSRARRSSLHKDERHAGGECLKRSLGDREPVVSTATAVKSVVRPNTGVRRQSLPPSTQSAQPSGQNPVKGTGRDGSPHGNHRRDGREISPILAARDRLWTSSRDAGDSDRRRSRNRARIPISAREIHVVWSSTRTQGDGETAYATPASRPVAGLLLSR